MGGRGTWLRGRLCDGPGGRHALDGRAAGGGGPGRDGVRRRRARHPRCGRPGGGVGRRGVQAGPCPVPGGAGRGRAQSGPAPGVPPGRRPAGVLGLGACRGARAAADARVAVDDPRRRHRRSSRPGAGGVPTPQAVLPGGCRRIRTSRGRPWSGRSISPQAAGGGPPRPPCRAGCCHCRTWETPRSGGSPPRTRTPRCGPGWL